MPLSNEPPEEAMIFPDFLLPQTKTIARISLRIWAAEKSSEDGTNSMINDSSPVSRSESTSSTSPIGKVSDMRKLFKVPTRPDTLSIMTPSLDLDTPRTIAATSFSKRQKLIHAIRTAHPTMYRQLRLCKVDERSESSCDVCIDSLQRNDTISVKCGHKYCPSCFERFVKAKLEDGHFPVECCSKVVSSKLVAGKVSKKVRASYAIAKERHRIAPENRWYCPNSRCLRTFDVTKARKTDEGAVCYNCHTAICIDCRGTCHARGGPCISVQARALLEEGKLRGWKQCPKCRIMIEIIEGCRHMKCRSCSCQFCFVCEKKWMRCQNVDDCNEIHYRYMAGSRGGERSSTSTSSGAPSTPGSRAMNIVAMTSRKHRSENLVATMMETLEARDQQQADDQIAAVQRAIDQEEQETAEKRQKHKDHVAKYFERFHQELGFVSEHQHRSLNERQQRENDVNRGPSWQALQQTQDQACLCRLDKIRKSLLEQQENLVSDEIQLSPAKWWSDTENDPPSTIKGKKRQLSEEDGMSDVRSML